FSRLVPRAAVFAALLLAACSAERPAVDAEKLRRARMMEDLMLGRGEIGGPFTLTDHTGARRPPISAARWCCCTSGTRIARMSARPTLRRSLRYCNHSVRTLPSKLST